MVDIHTAILPLENLPQRLFDPSQGADSRIECVRGQPHLLPHQDGLGATKRVARETDVLLPILLGDLLCGVQGVLEPARAPLPASQDGHVREDVTEVVELGTSEAHNGSLRARVIEHRPITVTQLRVHDKTLLIIVP